MSITLTRPQYDALITAALDADLEQVARIRDIIDSSNGIVRYYLSIRWQDVGGTPPPRIELGKGWPEDQSYLLELDRPITRADVDEVLDQNTVNPVGVMLTPDKNGVVGWTLINDYVF